MSHVYRRPSRPRRKARRVGTLKSTKRFLRPDSDLDAAGWTATPLWSKIDEVVPDDGDFITET